MLNAIEKNDQITQRAVAKDLDVALGMVNAYLKRCIKKGYVKVTQAPANRYAYYLTPTGFSEKSRLTADYLFSSFNFFRNARQECARILKQCDELGHKEIVLAGATDLAEIILLCAQEHTVEIVGVVDAGFSEQEFLALPVVADLSSIDQFDAVVVTHLAGPQMIYDGLVSNLPSGRIYTPSILGISRQAELDQPGAAQ